MPYAATYNSGGMPTGMGGMNDVDTGNDCVQTYATRVKQGESHLYDDVRTAAPQPAPAPPGGPGRRRRP
ncbi:hypothetical protein [Streptomyces sp. NPDC003032]